MSKSAAAELKSSIKVLQALPLMEKCQAAHQQASVFYDHVSQLHSVATVEPSKDQRAILGVIEEFEKALVAYAPDYKKAKLKKEAQAYAESRVLPGNQHPAAPYAQAEIRIRKLEILCAVSRANVDDAFLQFSLQQGLHLLESEGRWNDFFNRQAVDFSNS